MRARLRAPAPWSRPGLYLGALRTALGIGAPSGAAADGAGAPHGAQDAAQSAELPLSATPAALADTLAASCAQLTGGRPSADLCQQAAKNILAICLLMQHLPLLCPPPGSAAAAPLRALGADASGGAAAAADADDADAGDDEPPAEAQPALPGASRALALPDASAACCWAIRLVCRRLGARCREPASRAASLRLFGAIGAHLPPPAVVALLPVVLRTLLFSADDQSGKVDAPSREVAASVLQLLQERAGDEEYLRAYADARHALADARQRRLARIAVEAVTDVIGAARRKIDKHKAKRTSHKRKMDAAKMQSSTRGVLGVSGKKKRRTFHE